MLFLKVFAENSKNLLELSQGAFIICLRRNEVVTWPLQLHSGDCQFKTLFTSVKINVSGMICVWGRCTHYTQALFLNCRSSNFICCCRCGNRIGYQKQYWQGWDRRLSIADRYSGKYIHIFKYLIVKIMYFYKHCIFGRIIVLEK